MKDNHLSLLMNGFSIEVSKSLMGRGDTKHEHTAAGTQVSLHVPQGQSGDCSMGHNTVKKVKD